MEIRDVEPPQRSQKLFTGREYCLLWMGPPLPLGFHWFCGPRGACCERCEGDAGDTCLRFVKAAQLGGLDSLSCVPEPIISSRLSALGISIPCSSVIRS